MRFSLIVSVIGLIVLLTWSMPAQAQAILRKGVLVTVVVPTSVLAHEGYKSGWDSVSPIFGVELVKGPDGSPIPKDNPDWRVSGFPLCVEMKFEKIESKAGTAIAEYRSVGTPGAFASGPPGLVVKFRMATGLKPEEMLRPFVINGASTGGAVQSYITETHRLIAGHVFVGPLAGVPELERLALVKLAHLTAKGVGLSAETYKDNTYFAVELADDAIVYNDLKLNEGQRIAKVTNERLLTVIKAFAAPLAASRQVYGVRLHTSVAHKDFLKEAAKPSKDEVTLYAPADLIRKFADADITSQDFIDGCVVILNGNRIKVVLSST